MKDFTPHIYRNLLISLQDTGYSFMTFEEFCVHGKRYNKCVILRHDVDKRPEKSLKLAEIEGKLGIKATYYFRIVSESNHPEFIRKIAALNHEIAYHYEDLSLANGHVEKAYNSYKKNLDYFRGFYPIKTISMHGSPTSKYDNRDLWQKYNYRDYGIIGEPYFDFLNRDDVIYFTDTGRCWDGDQYNVRDKPIEESAKSAQASLPPIHSTQELINWISNSDNNCPLMISTHPQRWTDNKMEWVLELVSQNVKNVVKRLLVKRNG